MFVYLPKYIASKLLSLLLLLIYRTVPYATSALGVERVADVVVVDVDDDDDDGLTIISRILGSAERRRHDITVRSSRTPVQRFSSVASGDLIITLSSLYSKISRETRHDSLVREALVV